ncbi:MAG: primase protein [Candidatus Uhrbacteria bacterium GW2011_GWE2_40_58]|nr:MAG: primase protein [Candidatus Uhrbacteria bacterium GW2011_GWF2_40_263]KKR67973.1 MAG: primase protein [Candidatus Uhrbacteria bacterium GW2011_GWE2_40_58]OGL92419.1 MAG: DNA primase [Candidatus Uhrbacteria bacterium RIFOXYA2_FULL_40_9]OGL97010.1 MAG: DNA primase [Candidatus Uhrbacteria bacterium RIFOXYB2_FULL_41_18]
MDPKEEIKQKCDVVELVGEYLDLKPAGSGSFRAPCPFHAETAPSFYVSAEKQIWHCFGCGEGGDIFSFVMKMEGMDFPEALRHLGKKVGVEVRRFSSVQSQEKQRFADMNQLACAYYQKVLQTSSQAEQARVYVKARGIPQELIERFRIGYAPEAWDALAHFFAKRGYADHEGEKSGLLLKSRKGQGMIDRFRHRLMIPLCDHHGSVLGFTGRLLPGSEEKSAKYMNSPETPLYHKSDVLFGLDLAKRAIKENGYVIIVEGNLDVVASHKAGVEQVVASSGTALTEAQLNLLKRFTHTLVFAFDADAAGLAAAKKGIRLACSLEFDVRVISLPEGSKDPDELVQKDPSQWVKLTRATIPVMQYFIEKTVQGRDLSNIDEKRFVEAQLRPELESMQSVVEREHWFQIIADLLHTDLSEFRKSFSSITPNTSQGKVINKQNFEKVFLSSSGEDQTAMLLLGLFIEKKEYFEEVQNRLSEPLLFSEDLGRLYTWIKEEYHQTQDLAQKPLFLRLRQRAEQANETENFILLLDKSSLLAQQFVEDLPPQKVQAQLTQLAESLCNALKRKRKKALEADIRNAEQHGDHQSVERLIEEYRKLS